MNYPSPTSEQIDAEVARLQSRYEAFMKAQGELPDAAQLRAWAEENVRETLILETEAKARKLTVKALMEEITKSTPEVTLDEARAFFREHREQFIAPERVHAHHIVLHREDHQPAEALTTLLNLRTKLLTGACTWEDAVAQHSSCPGNSDLGFFPRGTMVERFEDAAFSTPEGELSEVIETEFGWHLIKVIAHLPEEPMLFEEAKPSLLAQLREERHRVALEAFVDARK